MTAQQCSVTVHRVESLLIRVSFGCIAIPKTTRNSICICTDTGIADEVSDAFFEELTEQCDGGRNKHGGVGGPRKGER